MTTFAELLAALARADVDVLVVGGLAVAQVGYPRFTEDADLLVEASEPNLERLISVLSTMGEGSAAALVPADFPLEEGAVRIIEDIVVDVFTLMSGHDYAALLPLSELHDINGEAVRFLSAEGLIRLKSPSLRPKDQVDVAALRRIQSGLDPFT